MAGHIHIHVHDAAPKSKRGMAVLPDGSGFFTATVGKDAATAHDPKTGQFTGLQGRSVNQAHQHLTSQGFGKRTHNLAGHKVPEGQHLYERKSSPYRTETVHLHAPGGIVNRVEHSNTGSRDAATARTNDPGIKSTMHEFKKGTLHSGSKKGKKVTSRKQAIAIGLSKQRRGDAGIQSRVTGTLASGLGVANKGITHATSGVKRLGSGIRRLSEAAYRNDSRDDIDLGRISATGDERRRMMGGKDYGTSQGAKKAAQTRKSGGGGQVTAAQSHTAGYHEQRARQLMDTPTNNNYVHGMALKRAATLHRAAANAIKTKAPNARKLSEHAHSFARRNFLHMT